MTNFYRFMCTSIAYAALSIWLPTHFAVTACNQEFITCFIEGLDMLWMANAGIASASCMWDVLHLIYDKYVK